MAAFFNNFRPPSVAPPAIRPPINLDGAPAGLACRWVRDRDGRLVRDWRTPKVRHLRLPWLREADRF
jgi:hypothetical protein